MRLKMRHNLFFNHQCVKRSNNNIHIKLYHQIQFLYKLELENSNYLVFQLKVDYFSILTMKCFQSIEHYCYEYLLFETNTKKLSLRLGFGVKIGELKQFLILENGHKSYYVSD